jgi:hypothetical protein
MRSGLSSMLLFVLTPCCANAGSGPLGIDHELSLDQHGIWAARYPAGLEYGVLAVEVGGAAVAGQ